MTKKFSIFCTCQKTFSSSILTVILFLLPSTLLWLFQFFCLPICLLFVCVWLFGIDRGVGSTSSLTNLVQTASLSSDVNRQFFLLPPPQHRHNKIPTIIFKNLFQNDIKILNNERTRVFQFKLYYAKTSSCPYFSFHIGSLRYVQYFYLQNTSLRTTI